VTNTCATGTPSPNNPVKGVKRPRAESGEGRTPALGDHQDLLAAPGRATLSTLLFHALRRDELCKLRVRDFRHARRGVPHLRVSGKGERPDKALTPGAVYKLVRRYSAALGFEIGAHALRATAATNAVDHQADITKV